MRPRDIKTDKINRRTMDYLTALHIYFEGHKIHEHNTFQDYYLDGEGEGRFSKRIQLCAKVNPFTKKPGGINQWFINKETVIIPAGQFNTINIRPKDKLEEQHWVVIHISLLHDDNANKSFIIRYVDESGLLFPGTSQVQTLIDSDGLTVIKNIQTPIYPKWHDVAGNHDHFIGFGPVPITKNSFIQITNITAMTANSTFTARWLQWRAK